MDWLLNLFRRLFGTKEKKTDPGEPVQDEQSSTACSVGDCEIIEIEPDDDNFDI